MVDEIAEKMTSAVITRIIGIALTGAVTLVGITINTKLQDLLDNQAKIGNELASVSKVVYDHQLYSAAASQEFRSGIYNNTRRIEAIEADHASEKRERLRNGDH